MTKLLDRMILRNFLQAYLICFLCFLSLYIVIDLFNKLDDFIDRSPGYLIMLQRMIEYYSIQALQIIDRLSAAVIFSAAMFTLAWMQRNNELIPILSAGVPMRRILRGVFVGAIAMLALTLANREWLIPRVADRLGNGAGDPRGESLVPVQGAYEPNDILIKGSRARRHDQVVKNFTCTLPVRLAGNLVHITAKEARYVPPDPEAPGPTGGWLMTGTTPADLPNWKEPVLEVLDPGKFFLHTERVNFGRMVRTRNWHQFTSTWGLLNELQGAKSARFSAFAVQLHQRFTAPLLTMIMIGMGLAVILRDQNRNVFIGAGLCLAVVATFYGLGYLCGVLGDYEYISPALAAWLPVLILGPIAFARLDAIHT